MSSLENYLIVILHKQHTSSIIVETGQRGSQSNMPHRNSPKSEVSQLAA